MRQIKHDSLWTILVATVLFLLAGAIRLVESHLPPLPSACCFIATNLLYIGLALAWGISISRRILHRQVRHHLLLGCAMSVLWLLLRAVKYRFFETGSITRYLWYLYYVPLILAPLFSFFAALQLGQREDATLMPRWYLLLLPAALLILGVLTNDAHQLAFAFAPGMVNWGADYRHGPLYYLVMAWTACFLSLAMGIIFRKCRISQSRRDAWIPLCVFAAGFTLSILSHLGIYSLHKLPECICMTFIALWESCLQVGLLPTNRRYLRFFSEATIAAQIADRHAQVLYRAKAAPLLTPEQLHAAQQGVVALSADTHLKSAPVHDGHVYWVENLSAVNRMKEQLETLHAQLSQEHALISAEAEIKRQRAQVEEKNRLFDEISRVLKPRLNRMDEMLRGKQGSKLALVCIWGAYVKRRSNLALICQKDAPVSVEELAYCIRESLVYLTAYGVACAYHQEGKGSVGGELLQTAYDFFEDCLEAALPTLSALMIRVACGRSFSIRLMMEDASALPDLARYRAQGRCMADQTDGGWCVTLILGEGGERP